MRTIHKQLLQLTDVQYVKIPKGSTILTVREQYDAVCMWYSCDTEGRNEIKTIYIIKTGQHLPDEAETYLGTAVLHSGKLVFHIYTQGDQPK
jgi:hypothetical protein